MNWYYADGTKQVGPLTDVDFENLVRNGIVKADTLVWHEGLPTWQPYGQVSGAGQPAAVQPPVIGPAVSQPGAVTVEQVVARDYEVGIGECLNRAWEIYKSNFGITLGATVLVLAVSMACSMIPFGIGSIVQLILQGPLMGGLYLFYIRQGRNQPAGLGDAFSGFGPRFTNLMLTHIVTALLAGLCLVPAIALFVVGFFKTFRNYHGGMPDFSAMGPLLIPAIVLLVIGVCVSTYLSVCWLFALLLAADKGMGFWDAMGLSRQVVRKHWWATFGFMFVAGLVGMVGLVGCLIGVLFTLPITFGMLVQLYDRVLGDLASQAD